MLLKHVIIQLIKAADYNTLRSLVTTLLKHVIIQLIPTSGKHAFPFTILTSLLITFGSFHVLWSFQKKEF